jgi:uncharacterized protein (DUF1697 family)
MRLVALLRGINVGGKTPVDMRELKSCIEGLGCTSVRTYINSGNVIFDSDLTAAELEPAIEAALEHRFGEAIPTVVRTREEIEDLVAQVPSRWRSAADLKVNVIFLRRAIDTPELLDGLEPKPGIEELHRLPGVLLWAVQRSALTRSTMLKLNRQPAYAHMTVRGLGTTLKLHELMREPSVAEAR